mmetsp:Transcript_17052/g.27375  ORF Transcript_17052/g.27375 Transcript_17052/m.27375 type:complete len:128 (-) Transcript_17052:148-531(-)
MQIYNCKGAPPSKSAGLIAVKTLRLSSYTHEQLHWALQCEGIKYANASAVKEIAVSGSGIPAVQLEPSNACGALHVVDDQKWWRNCTIAGVVLITCAVCLRIILRPPSFLSNGHKHKMKNDDEWSNA